MPTYSNNIKTLAKSSYIETAFLYSLKKKKNNHEKLFFYNTQQGGTIIIFMFNINFSLEIAAFPPTMQEW